MISLKNISKKFGNINALKDFSTEINDGSIYGLIGSNGAGKSTLLRLICGIYKTDSGSVLVDDEDIFENANGKEKIFYISDDQYYLPHSTMSDMAKYYANFYKNFDFKLFDELCKSFHLDKDRNLNTFSKGMQKQAWLIIGISSKTKYLLCDETFDGLDPVMRLAVKKLLINSVSEHNITPIISSHNLKELEDFCDHIGLLHEGGLIFDRNIDDLKTNIVKIQCAFSDVKTKSFFDTDFDVISFENQGKLCKLIVKGETEKIESTMEFLSPLYYEILDLSLDEIFVVEMEGLGYDIKKIFF